VARIADTLFVALGGGAIVSGLTHGFGFNPLFPTTAFVLIAGFFAWRPAPTLTGVAAWLDARHDLADLLSSAWATRDRRDEPWAAALGQLAATRVVALPSAGRLARFASRHHACVAAAGVALWLAGGLVRPPAIESAGASITRGATADRADTRQTAAIVRRQRDTAGSEGRLPGSAEPHAGSPVRAPARSPSNGDNADGAGRADSNALTALPPSAIASDGLAGTRSSAGGSGRATAGIADPAAGGRVQSSAGRPGQAILPAGAGTANDGSNSPTPAAVPADYRDLVRDFFAR
jgi:hypothetical protein